MKHTQSPWRMWPDHWAGGSNSHQIDGQNVPWVESDDGEICRLMPKGIYCGEAIANGKLICESPMMLQSLIKLIDKTATKRDIEKATELIKRIVK